MNKIYVVSIDEDAQEHSHIDFNYFDNIQIAFKNKNEALDFINQRNSRKSIVERGWEIYCDLENENYEEFSEEELKQEFNNLNLFSVELSYIKNIYNGELMDFEYPLIYKIKEINFHTSSTEAIKEEKIHELF